MASEHPSTRHAVHVVRLAAVVQVGVVLVGLVQRHSHRDVLSTRLMMIVRLIVPHQHFHCHFLWRAARRQLGRHLPPFGFISPVLEPDFHLSLIQLQRGRDLHAPRTGQVLVEVELFLQLRQLLGGKVGPDCIRLAPVTVFTRPPCRQRNN